MPIAKLGQLSATELSDTQQKHWDVDMKIRDMLSIMSLEQKMGLLTRLPGLIDEIKMEIARREVNQGE